MIKKQKSTILDWQTGITKTEITTPEDLYGNLDALKKYIQKYF